MQIEVGVIIGMAIVFFYAVLGGMKGITYTQVAQYCVLILPIWFLLSMSLFVDRCAIAGLVLGRPWLMVRASICWISLMG